MGFIFALSVYFLSFAQSPTSSSVWLARDATCGAGNGTDDTFAANCFSQSTTTKKCAPYTWTETVGGTPTTHYECTLDTCFLFTTSATCAQSGYCVWYDIGSGNKGCLYDPCLKSVSDGTSACADDLGTSFLSTYGKCSLYFFTSETLCNGTVKMSDRFCQYTAKDEASSLIVKTVDFDYCFYHKLKSGSCDDNTLCAPVEISDSGSPKKSVCQSNGDPDCADNIGDPQAFCDCLNSKTTEKENICNLSPYCWYTGGNCVYDQCTRQFNNTACFAGGCIEWNMNKVGGGLESICINKSRTSEKQKPNECYFLLSDSTKCDDAPDSQCTSGKTLKTNGDGKGVVADPEVNCVIEKVSPGIFPVDKYCNDGRDIPVINEDAATLVRIPAFLAVMLVVVSAFFTF